MKHIVVFSVTLLLLFSDALRADDKQKPVQKPITKKIVPLKLQENQFQSQPPILFQGLGRFTLLQRPRIRKELEIDEDQQQEIAKAHYELRKSRRIFGRNTGKIAKLFYEGQRKREFELQMKLLKLIGAINRVESDLMIEEILSQEQLERLDQMAIQMQGIWALQNPEIARKLKLTEDQKKKLQKVHVAENRRRQELHQDNLDNNVGRDKYRKKIQELENEIEKKALEVLGKEQSAQFQKMKGKKFDTRIAQRYVEPVPGEFDQLELQINGKDALDGSIVLPVGERFQVSGQLRIVKPYKGRAPIGAILVILKGAEKGIRLGGPAGSDSVKFIGNRRVTFSCDVGKPRIAGEYTLTVVAHNRKIIMQTNVRVEE